MVCNIILTLFIWMLDQRIHHVFGLTHYENLSQIHFMHIDWLNEMVHVHFGYNINIFLFFILASTFVGFAWSFSFFIPATTANDLRLGRISIPDFIHYIYFLILILGKEPVFSLFNVQC